MTHTECSRNGGSDFAGFCLLGCPVWDLAQLVLGQGTVAEVGETSQLPLTVPPQELEDLQNELPGYLRNLVSEDANVLEWHTLLLPVSVPRIMALGRGD